MRLENLLRDEGVDFTIAGHHHCRPGWIQMDCPFCGKGAKKYHLGYNLSEMYFNCWRCGFHPFALALSEIIGRPQRECWHILHQLDYQQPLPYQSKTGRMQFPKGVGAFELAHKRYLKDRGFDPAEIQALWHVQGIGLAARLAWRLFIPFKYRGETVAWTTRAIIESKYIVRYVSSKPNERSMDPHDLLYGEDYCTGHSIVVHEGPSDVWRTGPGSVATLGVNFSAEQMLRMSSYPVRAVCFDNDSSAQKRAAALCDELESWPGETVNVTLDAKDAASADAAEIAELRMEFLSEYS